MGLSPILFKCEQLEKRLSLQQSPKRIDGPHWDLERLKKCVNERPLYLSKTKAREPIQKVLGAKTHREAREIAKDAILHMNDEDYVETLKIEHALYPELSRTMDVYGIVYRGFGWYVKFYIEIDDQGDETSIISFHPPEYDLTTQSRQIPKGGMVK